MYYRYFLLSAAVVMHTYMTAALLAPMDSQGQLCHDSKTGNYRFIKAGDAPVLIESQGSSQGPSYQPHLQCNR